MPVAAPTLWGCITFATANLAPEFKPDEPMRLVEKPFAGQKRPCAMCGARAHHLPVFRGAPAKRFCCACLDAWMVDLAGRLDPDEGAEGLTTFWSWHWSECNYRPAVPEVRSCSGG